MGIDRKSTLNIDSNFEFDRHLSNDILNRIYVIKFTIYQLTLTVSICILELCTMTSISSTQNKQFVSFFCTEYVNNRFVISIVFVWVPQWGQLQCIYRGIQLFTTCTQSALIDILLSALSVLGFFVNIRTIHTYIHIFVYIDAFI